MGPLKARLNGILEFVPAARPIVYLDYPVHLNFGDILIMRGTERFFADHVRQVISRHAYMNFGCAARTRISREVVIVMHGGGNFGDIYPVHQRFREQILRDFPDNRIVILPQTVHFSSVAERDRSAALFRKHRDLVLCVRDRHSLEIVGDRFTEKVQLYPDMAHQLWSEGATPVCTDGPVLRLLRTDVEAGNRHRDVNKGSAMTKDWLDFIPTWSRRVFGRLLWAHRVEGRIGRTLGSQIVWYEYCAILHRHFASVFRRYGTVSTDRLHGMIFAMLEGKPVRYGDNTYGKLSSYADTWLAAEQSIGTWS